MTTPDATRRVDPARYTAEYYSAVQGGSVWARTGGARLPPRLARALRLACVAPGMRLLDMGTGRGELALTAAARGVEALGIDYSASSIAIARRALESRPAAVRERCEFRQMDCTRLELEDAGVDRVVMLDLVEHLYPEQLQLALREVARVLRPGGRLVIHTEPNLAYVRLAMPVYTSRPLAPLLRPVLRAMTGSEVPFSSYREEMHVNEQDPRSLRRALAEAGLRGRVWAGGIYGREELREPRQLLKRALLTGWPLTAVWPLRETFGLNVWAIAHR